MTDHLICHTEASSGFGGQEIRTLAEAAWLVEHGYRTLLICQPGSRILREADLRHLATVPVTMRSALDAGGFLRVRRVLADQRVSLVHTHSSIDSWLATLAARSLGIPAVRTRHVSIPIRRRRAFVYRLAHRVITTGEAIRTGVIAAGVSPSKVVSIAAGVDLERFHPDVCPMPVRRELQAAGFGSGKVVGLIANIRGSKGHRDFLAAAQFVLATRPDTRFLIVGEGVGFDDVRRQVVAMDLAREVLLTGFRRDVEDLMAALDVLVLPSLRSEGIPQVLVQALAMAKPVVATRVGSIPEVVVDGETGALVPPGDPVSLASAIVALLADPERCRRLGHEGRVRIREAYSMERVMARTVTLYEDLLGPARDRIGHRQPTGSRRP